jgi:dienelactone hydrolase
MKQKLMLALAIFVLLTSCNEANNKQEAKTERDKAIVTKTYALKTENVDYSGDGVTMKGFVAYNEDTLTAKPIVLILPEWWGIGDYTHGRAKQLAELGYLAFAVDMYGDGKTADNPDDAGKLATPFYTSATLAKSRFDAAMTKIKMYKFADANRVAAIGYCFGGAMVLNMARAGEPLKGVVSFHGNLVGNKLDKSVLKADVLVCHGDDDKFVLPTEVATFKKQMDSVSASYTFKSYAGATHAFTNPAATEKGKKYNLPIAYNAAADTASFNEMKVFLEKIFK